MEAMTTAGADAPRHAGPGLRGAMFAAIDLGTNNCRLLIARPAHDGFRVVDSFSRIVRLGEGLTARGRLGEAAMSRTFAALEVCAEKIARRGVLEIRAVATAACRAADNGAEFLHRVERATGLRFQIISPREEVELGVAACGDLIDPKASAALVVDVGGGSTELSFIDLEAARRADFDPQRGRAPIAAWRSIPIGVVNLAERFPEAGGGEAWRGAMVEAVREALSDFAGADRLAPAFAEGRAHIIGASGAITSLAGVHLGLTRYERRRVDGLWLTRNDCEAAADKLAAMSLDERARSPCIGPDRADLVLAGAAILQAVQSRWPAERLRVADRGLREGALRTLIWRHQRRRRRSYLRRAGSRGAHEASA
ncbi:MAG: Ppx/GppA family phosphatase [Alphaproteobacteria bacterium]|nr:Ppx/GppA family phosphatase [Alphaproteobacteria bacterium]